MKRQKSQSFGVLQRLFFRSFSSSAGPPVKIFNGSEASYAYAEAIVEAVHEPIIILDKSLNILSANKAFYKTFKQTKKSIIGHNVGSFINQNQRIIPLVKKLRDLSKQNTSFEEFELTYTFEKVGPRTLIINAKRIILGKNVTDFLLMGIEDITKRRMLEQEKDDCIGFVTHELKTPITTVSAFLQILKSYHEKTGDKKSQFLLSKALNQMDRLTGLLHSFTNVYKARTGRLEIHKTKMDLQKLVHEVIEAFQYTTATHNLVIEGQITHLILADRERVHEVLINLIINAIKYSPRADQIVIQLSETPQEAIVSITDFGIGIKKTEQEKVFERFFRAKKVSDANIKGLGLGLYLVAEIIKQHKGRLWVESKLNQGSTFSFALPFKK